MGKVLPNVTAAIIEDVIKHTAVHGITRASLKALGRMLIKDVITFICIEALIRIVDALMKDKEVADNTAEKGIPSSDYNNYLNEVEKQISGKLLNKLLTEIKTTPPVLNVSTESDYVKVGQAVQNIMKRITNQQVKIEAVQVVRLESQVSEELLSEWTNQIEKNRSRMIAKRTYNDVIKIIINKERYRAIVPDVSEPLLYVNTCNNKPKYFALTKEKKEESQQFIRVKSTLTDVMRETFRRKRYGKDDDT